MQVSVQPAIDPVAAVLGIAFLLAVKLSSAVAFGFPPIVVALTLLAIPVILINTYVGIQQVDPDTAEAAPGSGHERPADQFAIELSLAAPWSSTAWASWRC